MAIFCREYAKGRSAAEILREQGIDPKIFGENSCLPSERFTVR